VLGQRLLVEFEPMKKSFGNLVIPEAYQARSQRAKVLLTAASLSEKYPPDSVVVTIKQCGTHIENDIYLIYESDILYIEVNQSKPQLSEV